MRKMIPTDFVLTLPNILGHWCTCIKSHDQTPRVKREFLIPVKMAENLVGYARNYLFWHVFAEKCIVRLQMLMRFFKICNNRFFVPWFSYCCDAQNVHTCLLGMSYDKTYALYTFYHMKKVNK